MKKCLSCNILFNIKDNKCPLCQNILIGDCRELMYPANKWLKTKTLILKILLFISLTIFLIWGFTEYLVIGYLKYSLYGALALFSNYVVVSFIFRNYKNIFNMLGKYGLVIIMLLLIWYLVTKSRVITNFIIPGVCILELLFNFIVGLVLKKKYLGKYSSLLIINIILMFLPIILVLLKMTTFNILAYICFLSSIIAILALLIFCFDEIKEELSKIFNV